MNTDRELMQQALDALENTTPTGFNMESDKRFYAAITALRERVAQPEFSMHEEGEDGWSDFVCPDPKGYLMKCCDCGLVHEAQFKVVRYKSETEREDCEPVDDPNLQAVFRMRRSEQWSPKDTAYRPGGLAQPEQEPVDVGQLEYFGNSVAFIHQKMTAYRNSIDAAWAALWSKGIHPDGNTSVADAIKEYVAPTQRTWAGSGDLEDSNAYLTPAQLEDLAAELFVVAQQSPADDGFSDTINRIESWLRKHFTTPPQRKPLTDEEIDALPLPPSGTATVRDLVRIIEAAHGIGEKPDAA